MTLSGFSPLRIDVKKSPPHPFAWCAFISSTCSLSFFSSSSFARIASSVLFVLSSSFFCSACAVCVVDVYASESRFKLFAISSASFLIFAARSKSASAARAFISLSPLTILPSTTLKVFASSLAFFSFSSNSACSFIS